MKLKISVSKKLWNYSLKHLARGVNRNGSFVGSGLYLRSSGDGTNAQYMDVRKLIWTGQCTGLNLTGELINGGAGVLGTWDWGTPPQRNAIGPDSGNVHTTHMHIRPQGSLTNQ